MLSSLPFVEAPDHQWWLKKQRPTQFGDRKHFPRNVIPVTAVIETIEEFIDKHAIVVLEKLGISKEDILGENEPTLTS